MPAPRNQTVEKMMGAVRWIGFGACSLAAVGYAAIGNYNMAGAMLALAVLSWINIRRKRSPRPPER
ncbi:MULTISPECIES: hypothetical protein [Stutzerimonas stutzeri subgroup]|uniref:Uncharacterized protein n=1 Tax=Stutzerimonas stutzeri TaxID=316 RepID=A0A2N8RHE5_STUST|nr:MULTISPECIES: hypothetical protein [Stutzerimonas stutzeri subgroup]MDH2240462.1 hypothetical protein [Pseudomonas sp. GD03909]MDH2244791.1 hypothetical protein [Pseudomonas sp. GD03856]MDH2263481.1 hypothetical protein [Pseudomonas sp. GD03855]NMY66141.1 hypothetical protein [Pseudomonas sp. WS 5018]HAB86076.1 hypothetical protein [Pseudomonas sp.]